MSAQGREIWVDWKGRENGWGVGKNKENKLQDDESTMQNSGVSLRAESQHFTTVHYDNLHVASMHYFLFEMHSEISDLVSDYYYWEWLEVCLERSRLTPL